MQFKELHIDARGSFAHKSAIVSQVKFAISLYIVDFVMNMLFCDLLHNETLCEFHFSTISLIATQRMTMRKGFGAFFFSYPSLINLNFFLVTCNHSLIWSSGLRSPFIPS